MTRKKETTTDRGLHGNSASPPTRSSAILDWRHRSGVVAHDLVMRHAQVSIDEECVVVGVEDRLLDIIAGELANGIQRVPQREEQELGVIAVHPTKREDALVPRCCRVLSETRPLEIALISISVACPRRALPHSRDHRGLHT